MSESAPRRRHDGGTFINAKFASKCGHCKRAVEEGAAVLWVPAAKKVFCADDECADKALERLEKGEWKEAQRDLLDDDYSPRRDG